MSVQIVSHIVRKLSESERQALDALRKGWTYGKEHFNALPQESRERVTRALERA